MKRYHEMKRVARPPRRFLIQHERSGQRFRSKTNEFQKCGVHRVSHDMSYSYTKYASKPAPSESLPFPLPKLKKPKSEFCRSAQKSDVWFQISSSDRSRARPRSVGFERLRRPQRSARLWLRPPRLLRQSLLTHTA